MVGCRPNKSNIAKGTALSDLHIEATINVAKDRLSTEADELEILVKIHKGTQYDSVRLSSGGSVVVYMLGVSYPMDLIVIDPIPPYSYETLYRYSIRAPTPPDNTEIRIALIRPAEASALSSTVSMPTKPVILLPLADSTLFRTDDVDVTWVPEAYNDSMRVVLGGCHLSDNRFYPDDIGNYTILSDVYLPYATPCSGGVGIRRTRTGTPDVGLGASTISAYRSSYVSVNITP